MKILGFLYSALSSGIYFRFALNKYFIIIIIIIIIISLLLLLNVKTVRYAT